MNMVTSPSQTKWSEQTSSSLFVLGSAIWFSTRIILLATGASDGWLHAGFGTAYGLLFSSMLPQITLDLKGPSSRPLRKICRWHDYDEINVCAHHSK
jgi:hypothetical protein